MADFMAAAKQLWLQGLSDEFKSILREYPPNKQIIKNKKRGLIEAEKDKKIVSTILELN